MWTRFAWPKCLIIVVHWYFISTIYNELVGCDIAVNLPISWQWASNQIKRQFFLVYKLLYWYGQPASLCLAWNLGHTLERVPSLCQTRQGNSLEGNWGYTRPRGPFHTAEGQGGCTLCIHSTAELVSTSRFVQCVHCRSWLIFSLVQAKAYTLVFFLE